MPVLRRQLMKCPYEVNAKIIIKIGFKAERRWSYISLRGVMRMS